MGKIRKILETELVGGTQSTDVYPVTSTKAVYDTNNKVLDDYIQHLKKTSTFAGIATPTTNPGTPDGPVFYIAGEGTYANFSNIVIEAGQLGILKWNGTWSKEVLEIGAGGGSGGGSGVSFGTLLAQLNNENPFPTTNGQVLTYNGTNFVWKTPTGGSGVALSPTMNAMNNQLGETTLNTPQFLYWDGSTYTWKNESEISGGSGSSSRIKNIKLFTNNSDYSFETIKLGTADTIGFMAGNNVSLEAVVKEFTNVIKISATGGSGGSGSSGTTDYSLTFYKDGSAESWNGEKNFRIIFGNGLNVDWDTNHTYLTLSATGGNGGSTSTSVSWEDVTGKPSTFTPSSHKHSTSDINGLSSFKVSNATNADTATKLANSRLIWGQRFNGTGDINGNLKMGTEGGGSIQLWMNNGNMLDRTNNRLHIGYGLKGTSDGEINLDANITKIYTDNYSKHYDFKSNVFDVNSNQIHFGSETNGGKISWDAANNAFKIEGNVYATGGITALGVSNNATTSNNVDFTFKSVTINGTSQHKVQLTDEGLVFYSQDNINAYYKKDSIGLYDSVTDACCKIFGFTDSKLVFDPDRYSVFIKFNTAIECITDENTLVVGNNTTNGYIVFSAGSTMTFNHNNKNYNFNVAKAIEQGILTI